MRTGALILAAHLSVPKDYFTQLQKSGNISFVERITASLQKAGVKNMVVVTGRETADIEKGLRDYGVTFLSCDSSNRENFAEVLKKGMRYLQGTVDRVLLCPANVPFFRWETVERLMDASERLVVPMWEQQQGYPISVTNEWILTFLESKKYVRDEFLEYLSLEIEKGNCCMVSVEDSGVVLDIQDIKEYETIEKKHDTSLMRVKTTVQLAKRKTFLLLDTVLFLKHIRAFDSVREACKKSGISYSKGWSIIKVAEEELGYPIVERTTGGKNGGHTVVTPKGERLIALFETFENRVEQNVQEIYQEIFAESGLL